MTRLPVRGTSAGPGPVRWWPKATSRIFAQGVAGSLALLAVWALPRALAAQSSNGIYGGYVGSTAWFSSMREMATNQAMLRSLSPGSTAPLGKIPVPPGYIEVAGEIRFQDGNNPFPDGRLPDLHLVAEDHDADPVLRSPYVGQDRSFYAVLKRGVTYDVQWMYYFGSLETWAKIAVTPKDSRHRVVKLVYSAADTSETSTEAASTTPSSSTGETPTKGAGQASASNQSEPQSGAAAEVQPPPDADHFDTSALPDPPQTFEEQQIWSSIRSASTPTLKAEAHARLAEFYRREGKAKLAEAEKKKAAYWAKK